jgi:ABC-type dipeptide/oligopeptide/nickel transport system ATPase component
MTTTNSPVLDVAETPEAAGRDTGEAPLLRVTDLQVHLPTGTRREVRAVSSVSLTVHRGERVGIVGESGSGKSVTGRAIAGLLPTSPRVRIAGSIRFSGAELLGAPTAQWNRVRSHTVGMIFQDPLTFLNPTMKVGAQVAEAVAPDRRLSRGSTGKEVLRFLELVGLPDVRELAQRFPHELSGGMRQRVLIAIAIAKEPDLLIADEPTTALDATVQRRVLAALGRTVSELGSSLILISHDLAVVSSMTDRIYVMYAGRVVESGATGDVLTRPSHPYTQALLRSVTSLTDDGAELYSMPVILREQLARGEEPHAS